MAFHSFLSCTEHKLPKARKGKDKHIICITIPKTGTHLLYKCLQLLKLKNVVHLKKNGVSQRMLDKIQLLNQNPPPNHWKGFFHIPTVGPIPEHAVKMMKSSKKAHSFSIHWPFTHESEAIFNKYGRANFFTIRDPRDQLVSMVYMIYKSRDGRQIPFEDALIDLIDGRQKVYIPWAAEIQTAHPLMWELGVVDFYKLYLPWMNSPKFYTVKFENLVGPKGGGQLDTQIQELQKIAQHLGVDLPASTAYAIAKKLFGNTLTFREGQIGSWKKYFTPRIKEIFKMTPGACQLLIDLGYEKDDAW